MKLQTYSDASAFVQRVQPFLETREAVNSLVLGITLRIQEKPDWLRFPPYEAVVEDAAGNLLLVAIQTPPQNILIAGVENAPQPAIDLLIKNLKEIGAQFPGVNAENQLALNFAQSWSLATGKSYHSHMRERLYELRKVIPPSNPPPGFFRPATMDEVVLLANWHDAFIRESLHEDPPPDSLPSIERSIQAGNLFVWENGKTVSVAMRTRPIPHGASIGNVYTPPELRGRGYASACVAALSQYILDSGKQFATLFTDLDYPTSNAIYQRIGYRPVCDFTVYRFE